MALDKFQPYLFVSAGEQSNKYLIPTYANGIAQFQAQRAQEITGLTVQFGPIQEGSGEPSPTNIRPISGRTDLTVTVQSGDTQNTYPISWQTEAGTVYGGTLNVTTGVLTVDKGYINYDGSENWNWQSDGTYKRAAVPLTDTYNPGGRVSVQSNAGTFRASGNDVGTIFTSGTTLFYYPDASITSLADYKTWLASNNLQVVYPLATPQTYQLTPADIKTLAGFNQIYSNAGPVIDIKF